MITTYVTPAIPTADFNAITGTIRQSATYIRTRYGLQVRTIRTNGAIRFKVTGRHDSVDAFAQSY